MSWTPEYKQDALFSMERPNSHSLTHSSMFCPECGRAPLLEMDTAKGPRLFHHRFRVMCSNDKCSEQTQWMDSSEEAVKNWRMQIILKRE